MVAVAAAVEILMMGNRFRERQQAGTLKSSLLKFLASKLHHDEAKSDATRPRNFFTLFSRRNENRLWLFISTSLFGNIT